MECHSKDTVNDVAIDVSVKVQLHDIVILQDSVVTSIGAWSNLLETMTYKTKINKAIWVFITMHLKQCNVCYEKSSVVHLNLLYGYPLPTQCIDAPQYIP